MVYPEQDSTQEQIQFSEITALASKPFIRCLRNQFSKDMYGLG